MWTIKNGQVTLTKMADLPPETLIGNANLSGAGAPQALTAVQVKSMLNIDTGDIVDFAESVLALLASTLVQGSNITISPNSAGQLVISATGGASGPTWTNSSSAPAPRLTATSGSTPTPGSSTATSTTAPHRSGWSYDHRLSDLARHRTELHVQRPHLAMER